MGLRNVWLKKDSTSFAGHISHWPRADGYLLLPLLHSTQLLAFLVCLKIPSTEKAITARQQWKVQRPRVFSAPALVVQQNQFCLIVKCFVDWRSRILRRPWKSDEVLSGPTRRRRSIVRRLDVPKSTKYLVITNCDSSVDESWTMDKVARWSNGAKSLRGVQELSGERQKLLDGHDSDEESFRTRVPRVPKVRKAKQEDSFSDEDDSLIPLGPISRPPKPPPGPDQCIEVRHPISSRYFWFFRTSTYKDLLKRRSDIPGPANQNRADYDVDIVIFRTFCKWSKDRSACLVMNCQIFDISWLK